MTHSEALARALRFSTLRKVKYRVWAGKRAGRWVYYIAAADSLLAVKPASVTMPDRRSGL